MIVPDSTELLSATVGARIQRLRLKQNLSVRDLADKAGVDKNTILRVEKGLTVSGRTLDRVCRALDVYVSRLLLPEPEEGEAVVLHRRTDEVWWPYPGMGDPFPGDESDTGGPPPLPSCGATDGDPGPHPTPKVGTQTSPRGFVASLACRMPRGKMRSSLLRLWDETTPNAHPGEEFVFCLSGKACLTVAGRPYLLNEGDAATFYCAERHTYAPAPDSPQSSLPVLLLTVWHDE
ncbi:MAG: helix-turn-helix transcriptional regulator [Fibrella sp.]|nr:helix-turn-helix transcriptional regulator [Armatimonadota bacterium]